MDTRQIARIGAVSLAAAALAMTAAALQRQPRRDGPEIVDVTEPDSDSPGGQLRQCAALGEAAQHMPQCLAAWAEQRRRFLGGEVRQDPLADKQAAMGSAGPAGSPPAGGE